MASFGANLRREREMRGVPLDEIAAATKISVRCLQALEAEEFSKLPGGIFTRSFIRAYARYLGLDEEKVMAEFQVIAPPMEDADFSRLSPSNSKPPRKSLRTPVLIALIAVATLGGGYVLYRFSRRAIQKQGNIPNSSHVPTAPLATTTPPLQSTVQPAPATTGAIVPATGLDAGRSSANSNPPDVSQPPQAVGASIATVVNSAETPAALTLQVATTEQTWVAVDADGKTALQGVLKPNDIKTFKAQKSFDVMTGNAQGIILTLNGVTLKPLGSHGEVKKVHLTQKDLKNLNP
ncbi:MAG: helix-turn-helix domain-containing protein [Terriglobia bacterium]